MSLIKLASTPVIVVNNNKNSNSNKSLAAATVGGTAGFLANEGIERMKKFDSTKMSHRYGRRMGGVLAGTAAAAGVYSYLNKRKQQQPNIYML